MISAHDWHVFNEQRGLEVRHTEADEYEVRHVGDEGVYTTLDEEAWDRVRSGELVIFDGE